MQTGRTRCIIIVDHLIAPVYTDTAPKGYLHVYTDVMRDGVDERGLAVFRILLAVLLVPGLVCAQGEEEKDIWAPFEFFVGKWEGTGQSKAGTSTIEAEFEFVLNGQFLEVRHISVFEPQEKIPEGEIHADIGYISYDRIRETFVFRQFHVEGFVNQYVLDSLSSGGETLVFETEAMENGPPGWRARLTHEILSEDEYMATFELATPGKDFACFIENHLTRKAVP